MFELFIRLLNVLTFVLSLWKSKKEAEAATQPAPECPEPECPSVVTPVEQPKKESKPMLHLPTIDFESVKAAALRSLDDSGAKDELVDLLESHKEIFVEESRGYLKALVSTFKDGEYNPEEYRKLLDALSNAQLVSEVVATADQLEGVVKTHQAKKKLVEDLKDVASAAVRKAAIAGLVAAVGPVAGPLAGLLSD